MVSVPRRKRRSSPSPPSPARQYAPLSSHEVFRSWAGAAPWSAGTAAFGSVIGDLVDGVVDFVRKPRRDSHRVWEMSAGVGCVPWMNNERVTAALASLQATCIVMNKGAFDQRGANALLAAGSPLPIHYLRGFDDMAKPMPDGSRPVMTPYGLAGETLEELGPVRAAGWRGDKKAPLLHAKLLVLGDAIGWDDDEGPDWGVHYHFEPKRAWLGSANWTKGATEHLEFGLWTTDPALVERTYRFVLDVVRFSEPFDTAANYPEPELVAAEWDNAAFAEAAAEWDQAQRENEAEDQADDG